MKSVCLCASEYVLNPPIKLLFALGIAARVCALGDNRARDGEAALRVMLAKKNAADVIVGRQSGVMLEGFVGSVDGDAPQYFP